MAERSNNGDAIQRKAAAARGRSLGRLVMQILLAVLLTFALLGAAQHYLQQQRVAEGMVLQARGVAEGVAGRLSDYVRFQTRLLSRFVASPGLEKLLADRDWKRLHRLEKRYQRLTPDVLQVRFLPPEWDENKEGGGGTLPLKFAALDMLRQVERSGKPAQAELHLPGSAQQHIAIAVPITRSGKKSLVGVAHLALTPKVLQRMLLDVPPEAGSLSLQQVIDDNAVTLASSASGSNDASSAAGQIPLPGTIWRIDYWPAQGQLSLPDISLIWGLILAGLLAISVVALLQLRQLKQALRQDEGMILAYLKGLFQGNSRRLTAAACADLQTLMEQLPELESMLREQRRSVEATAPARSAPFEMEESASPAAATPVPAPELDPAPAAATRQVPAELFRAYDIRGQAEQELNVGVVYQIGRAIGSEAQQQGEQTVIVARDGRISSPQLQAALCRGLQDSGRDVVDLGAVPTPLLYFATHFLGYGSGVMVTGSHNPPQYNGLKVMIAGEALAGERIQRLRQRIEQDDLVQGEGSIRERDLVPDYIQRITDDIQLLRPLKVVLDCGNGIASVVAPALFRALSCEVIDLYCEVDGSFPNHHPDPGDPQNMQALAARVVAEEADLGIAFDGDGDRLGVVDADGKIIWPDRLLMLLARDVLMRQPGADVIYDVKSSRHLAGEILAYGGRPIMWKCGHSLVKAKMRETGAVLAGELTGHIFFAERWYGFDDGLYAAGRLLEVLSAEGLSSAEVFAQLPESLSTPELTVLVGESEGRSLLARLEAQGGLPDAKLITIDGIRAEFEDGWGLVRPSNTMPALSFRFEADDEAALARIQGLFRDWMKRIEPGLDLPF